MYAPRAMVRQQLCGGFLLWRWRLRPRWVHLQVPVAQCGAALSALVSFTTLVTIATLVSDTTALVADPAMVSNSNVGADVGSDALAMGAESRLENTLSSRVCRLDAVVRRVLARAGVLLGL